MSNSSYLVRHIYDTALASTQPDAGMSLQLAAERALNPDNGRSIILTMMKKRSIFVVRTPYTSVKEKSYIVDVHNQSGL